MGKKFALLNLKQLSELCTKSKIVGDEFIGHLKVKEIEDISRKRPRYFHFTLQV